MTIWSRERGATLVITNNGDNSYIVVNNPTFLDATAVLDGFTVSGGNNTDSYTGGGMFTDDDSNPTLTNCSFSSNSAAEGGGCTQTAMVQH